MGGEREGGRGKKTSDNAGGKATCGFSLQHSTFLSTEVL